MPTKKYLEELEKSREKNKNKIHSCSWKTYQKEQNNILTQNDWKQEDNKKQTEEEINNMLDEWKADNRTYEERKRDIKKQIEEEQNKNNNTN